MAVNFCNENLVKVSCNQVFSDHHDVQNLISLNHQDRQKGFLVEYYIRPPIVIKFEFTKYNLDLMYLQLGLKLRQHQSRGIEIYASTDVTSDGQLIAKCYNPNKEVLSIVNHLYRPHKYLPRSENSTFPDSFSIAGRNAQYCNNIKCLTVKVLSTFNSSVPCLSFIDIYGKPNSIYGENDTRAFCDISVKNTSTVQNCQALTQEDVTIRSQQIEHLAPPDFLDALTNELMKNPYTLPSGKNIDETCLHKLLDTQKNSNSGCDPFTRVPFTEQNKPILNIQLKQRIDQFHATNGQSEIDRRNELRRKLFNLA